MRSFLGKFFISLLLLISIVFAVLYYLKNSRAWFVTYLPNQCSGFLDFLAIKEIKPMGNTIVSSADILRRINFPENPCFWNLINQDEMILSAKRIPWISNVLFDYDFNKKSLAIAVIEEEPWLVADFEGNSWVVSKTGKLVVQLGNIRDQNLIFKLSELPRLDGIKTRNQGLGALSSENMRLDLALKMLLMLNKAGGFSFAVDFYRLSDEGYLEIFPREMTHAKKIVISATSMPEAKEKIKKLNAVLGDLRERNEQVSEIDLRFKSNVVAR